MSAKLNLSQICSIYNTDKNSYHSYVDYVYEDLFKELRDISSDILEIGAYNGASAMMWSEYFYNAKITTIDIKECPQIANRSNIECIISDAYDYATVSGLQKTFDIIIDDGSHELTDMVFVVEQYINKLKPNGILVIEDIQNFNWTNILKQHIPISHFSIDIRDLRRVKDRYDDIIMIITRRKDA